MTVRQLSNVLDSRYNEAIKAKGIEVIVYEPLLSDAVFFNSRVINDISIFKAQSDIVVANRITKDLEDMTEKVFTRDLFGAD